MARMYEMNLVIRLQDRASARMRRISGDMSALTRHAQAQNKLTQISTQQERAFNRELKARSELQNLTTGSGAQRNQSRMLSMRAQEITLVKALKNEQRDLTKLSQVYRSSSGKLTGRFSGGGTTFLSEKQASLALRYMSLQSKIRAEVIETDLAQQKLNITIAESVAEEARLAAAMRATAITAEKAAKLQGRYQSGRTTAHVGSLAFMGGAVGIGVLGAASKSFADFDVKAVRAATQFGDVGNSAAATTKQAKELESAILGMAKSYPASASQMADASYDIFSSMELAGNATQQFKAGLSLLETANKAAVAGQIDLADATDVMITILNNFDPALKHIDQNMAQLFATVRFMRGGFGDLGDAMNKIAPAAKNADQSLLQVGSAIAIVTRHMPSQAQAGTAISRLLEVFGRPDFINGMRKAGKEFDIVNRKTGKLLPLYTILDKIVKLQPQLQGGGIELGNLIQTITRYGSETGKGGTQATVFARRALTLLITGHKEHNSVLKQSTADTKEYEKSVKALSNTAGVKWQTQLNNLKVAFIQVGQSAIPVIMELTSAAIVMLNKWQNLDPTLRTMIIRFAAFAAIAATIGGILLSIGGGLRMLKAFVGLRGLERMAEQAGTARIAVVRLRLAIAALSAVAAAGVVLYILIKWKKRNETFTNWDTGIMKWADNYKKKHKILYWINPAPSIAHDTARLDKWQRGAATRQETQRNLDEANQKKSDEALKAHTHGRDTWAQDAYKKSVASMSKSEKSKLDEINKYNAAVKDTDKKLATWQKNLDKEKTRAHQDAVKQQKDDIKQYVKTLESAESAIRATNTTALGGLFGGPMSKGPLLGAFADINSQLSGLGLKPIKVPVEFILKDQAAAIGNFDDWRGALATLKNRLGPKYKQLIVDLQAQGMDNAPLVESMASASTKDLNTWAKNTQKISGMVESATKIDMDNTLKLWQSFPESVRAKILEGMSVADAQSKLGDSYNAWVVGNIPETLAKSFADRYQTALTSYLELNPKPKAPKPPNATGGGGNGSGGGPNSGPGSSSYRPDAYGGRNVGQNSGAILEFDYRNNLEAQGFYAYNPNLSRYRNMKQYPGHYAKGGVIPGWGRGDTVPAMLTPGEVVLNRKHVANASKMLGTANHPQALFNKVQHFDGGGVVEGYGTATKRKADYNKYVVPTLKKKHSRFSSLMHYGILDMAKDIDKAQSHVTGIHAKTAAKTYADFIPQLLGKKSLLSKKEQTERDTFAEGVMMGHGIGAAGATKGLQGFGLRQAVIKAGGGKKVAQNLTGIGRPAFGITPFDYGNFILQGRQSMPSSSGVVARNPNQISYGQMNNLKQHLHDLGAGTDIFDEGMTSTGFKPIALRMMHGAAGQFQGDIENAEHNMFNRLLIGYDNHKLTGLAHYMEHGPHKSVQSGVDYPLSQITYMGAKGGAGLFGLAKAGFQLAANRGRGFKAGTLLEDSDELRTRLLGGRDEYVDPERIKNLAQDIKHYYRQNRGTRRDLGNRGISPQRTRRTANNTVSYQDAMDIDDYYANLLDTSSNTLAANPSSYNTRLAERETAQRAANIAAHPGIVDRYRALRVPLSDGELERLYFAFNGAPQTSATAGHRGEWDIPYIRSIFNTSEELGRARRIISEQQSQLMDAGLGGFGVEGFAKGGWVRGGGNNDSVRAMLTPGEFVLSREMISGLTQSNTKSNEPTTVVNNTHNYNGVDEKSIATALAQQEFRLRHKGK